jgi:hypothetical protein
MNKVQFSETNFLRLASVICLGIADILLVADLWWMFFNLFVIAVLSELLRKRLYEAMLYNYEVENRNHKVKQMKERADQLMKMKKDAGVA